MEALAAEPDLGRSKGVSMVAVSHSNKWLTGLLVVCLSLLFASWCQQRLAAMPFEYTQLSSEVSAEVPQDSHNCLPCDLASLAQKSVDRRVLDLSCNLYDLTVEDIACGLSRRGNQAWFAFRGDSILRGQFMQFLKDFRAEYEAGEQHTFHELYHRTHLLKCEYSPGVEARKVACSAVVAHYDFSQTLTEEVGLFIGASSPEDHTSRFCISWEFQNDVDYGLLNDMTAWFTGRTPVSPSGLVLNPVLHPVAEGWPRRIFRDHTEGLAKSLLSSLKPCRRYLNESFDSQVGSRILSCGKEVVSFCPVVILHTGTHLEEAKINAKHYAPQFNNVRMEMFNQDYKEMLQASLNEHAYLVDSYRLTQHGGFATNDGIHYDGSEYWSVANQVDLNVFFGGQLCGRVEQERLTKPGWRLDELLSVTRDEGPLTSKKHGALYNLCQDTFCVSEHEQHSIDSSSDPG